MIDWIADVDWLTWAKMLGVAWVIGVLPRWWLHQWIKGISGGWTAGLGKAARK